VPPPPPTYPPEVTTKAATSVGTTSATLNGNLDSTGGLDCQVWFEYGTTISYGYSTSKQSKSTIGAFSAGISGLSSGTTYHFRAVASNSKGTDYGDDTTFTTLTPTPPLGYCPCGGTTYNEEWISRVQFNTIDKSSSGSGYADYTSISTDVARGSTYTLKVTIGQVDS
jgi:hypothetical protein